MANSSIRTRFTITKTGKIRRRAMAQGHFLSKKKSDQLRRKHLMRGLDDLGKKIAKKYIHK